MLRTQSTRQAHRTVTHTARIAGSASRVSVSRAPVVRNCQLAATRQQRRYEWCEASGSINEELTAWCRARQSAMKVDPAHIDLNPGQTDSTLAPPWRIALVPRKRLEMLRYTEYPCAGVSTMLWGIGPERPVSNCNPYDVNPGAIDFERRSTRPGKGPFRDIVRGAYGNRNFKFIYAIDHQGIHIVREMTPCQMSSRGIPTHSILVEQGIVAGEMWFDMNDPGKVYINFGSARLPLADFWQAEKTAEFILSLGYHSVVAVIPDRKLSDAPYGMADRYGSHVQNIEFRIADEAQEL